MKTSRLLLAIATLFLTACHCSKPTPVTPDEPDPEVKPQPVPTPSFAKGADISWVSEMEKGGRTFQLSSGTKADKNDLDKMAKHVSDHTTEVLKALQDAGVTPNWVQVGNETRNGMLWPAGQLWTSSGDIQNGRKNFAKLLNAGYDAVKSVFPSCTVLAHLNNAFEDNAWWFEQVQADGGKFDAIALSHYPQTESDWSKCNTTAIQRIQALISKFNKEVIVAEVGVKTPANATLAAQVLSGFMTEVKKISKCKGVFYWEPEADGKWKPAVYGTLGWNAYDMGAFTTEGKATGVMEAFR